MSLQKSQEERVVGRGTTLSGVSCGGRGVGLSYGIAGGADLAGRKGGRGSSFGAFKGGMRRQVEEHEEVGGGCGG